MKDNDIIKVLEEWLSEMHKAYQTHLEYGGRNDAEYERYIDAMSGAIEMINHQKTRIQELEEAKEDLNGTVKNLLEQFAEFKVEAIKEFAERLKKGCGRVKTEGHSMLVFQESSFDYIVAEVTGERE